jgi:hypothetical protein
LNAETMYRTVHEYGVYPIDFDRICRRRQAIAGSRRTRS